MRHIRLLSAVLSLCLVLSGCSSGLDRDKAAKEVRFEIPDYNLTLTADSKFEDVTDTGSFDLQITDGHVYLSVMAYTCADLSDGQTAMDLYHFHHTDLFSRRENTLLLEDETTETFPGRSITKTRYSAERDGHKNDYASYLVEFEDAEVFAWVLITAMPSYMEKHAEELNSIVATLTYTAP